MPHATPVGPPDAYQTYAVASPRQTHWVKVDCARFGCDLYANGWRTVVDEATPLGARQAHYMRADGLDVRVASADAARLQGRRRYRESHEAGLTVFTYPAGQQCFTEHHVPSGRPELYMVRDGDWRGNPTGVVRRHASAADWVEDLHEHTDRLNAERQKG